MRCGRPRGDEPERIFKFAVTLPRSDVLCFAGHLCSAREKALSVLARRAGRLANEAGRALYRKG